MSSSIQRVSRAVLSRAAVSSRPFASVGESKKTALFDYHVELGGKMVPFAGYAMPVQYTDGILKSHLHTREEGCASVFDVSHMGQLRIHGADRVAFMERVVVGDIATLEEGTSRLSLICNAQGGIMDDTVISNAGDHLYVVVNAGNKDKDMAHFQAELESFSGDASMEYIQDRSLLALQGPGAQDVMSSLLPASVDLTQMPFMTGGRMTVSGLDCIVTRCGYTGEDGFEISVPSSDAVSLMRTLLDPEQVLPAGLGARDSLRLEAGLCLHGHDIDETTTPAEAALGWTISKRRRAEGGFIGADVILSQITDKSFMRKRVGLDVTGGPIREGAVLLSEQGEEVGVVTSGTFSPSLKRAVAMGYVNRGHFKLGTQLQVAKRGGRTQAVKVAKMPFVPSNYYSVPK